MLDQNKTSGTTELRVGNVKDQATVYVLPLKFWLDHKFRDCSQSAIEVSRNKMYVTVILDYKAFADIYSDATYYATYESEEGEEQMRGLYASAKATLKRLEA